MRKAVIVMPTYNEAANIEKTLTKVFEVTSDIPNWDVEVLVVDSSSPDKTADVVENLLKKYRKLHLLVTKKEGLGKAYTDGFKHALDELKPFVIFEMDADFSHDPKKIPEFLRAIEKGSDFVIGSRYMKGGSIPKDWGLHRKFFSVIGNYIIRLGFMKLSITDWTTGYRAVKSYIIKDSLPHITKYSGYVFQVALLDFALKQKARISEIPITFKDREHGESKINFPQYMSRTLWYIFQHSSFVKFVIVGLLGFVVDFGISYLMLEQAQWKVWKATLLSTEVAIICNFLLNNFWSFSHKKLESKLSVYLKNFFKFNAVSSGSVAIQTIGLQLLTTFLGRQYWIFYKIGIIAFIIIPYSYLLYNKLIWKEK